MKNSDMEFEKFYKNGEYNKWRPEDGMLSKKTVMWQVWNAAWNMAYNESREDLAATLVRDLHMHMGKKKIIVVDH
jgi:hypothetical protein